jgi:arsenate reductase (thioredoxin)
MNGIAFVCVGNAGRSQMASAFAERERERRGLDLEVVTGGTDPAESVHGEVIDVMNERGIDVGDREPHAITTEDLAGVDRVVTMGCSVEGVLPDGWDGETESWEVSHPSGDDVDAARAQRDEIERRVSDLFDRIEDGS